jgi:hypothetical protein
MQPANDEQKTNQNPPSSEDNKDRYDEHTGTKRFQVGSTGKEYQYDQRTVQIKPSR